MANAAVLNTYKFAVRPYVSRKERRTRILPRHAQCTLAECWECARALRSAARAALHAFRSTAGRGALARRRRMDGFEAAASVRKRNALKASKRFRPQWERRHKAIGSCSAELTTYDQAVLHARVIARCKALFCRSGRAKVIAVINSETRN